MIVWRVWMWSDVLCILCSLHQVTNPLGESTAESAWAGCFWGVWIEMDSAVLVLGFISDLLAAWVLLLLMFMWMMGWRSCRPADAVCSIESLSLSLSHSHSLSISLTLTLCLSLSLSLSVYLTHYLSHNICNETAVLLERAEQGLIPSCWACERPIQYITCKKYITLKSTTSRT